jgi:hypothetical protein
MLQVFAIVICCSKSKVLRFVNREYDRSSGVPWSSPNLWFLSFLDDSLFIVPPFFCEKLHHELSQWVWSPSCRIFLKISSLSMRTFSPWNASTILQNHPHWERDRSWQLSSNCRDLLIASYFCWNLKGSS